MIITICALAFILFSSYLAILSSMILFNSDIREFKNSLGEEHLKMFSKVEHERRMHFLIGLFCSTICILIFVLWKGPGVLKGGGRACAAALFLLITTSIIYYFIPKSRYMVTYLETREQREKWFEVSRGMHIRKIVGMLIGVVVYVVYSHMRI